MRVDGRMLSEMDRGRAEGREGQGGGEEGRG